MIGPRLYLLQRLTALIMAPLVLTHIVVIVYAVQGSLDAAEILGRTRGSIGWGLFYGVFVAAVAIHASIGVRVIASEHFRWGKPALNGLTVAVALTLLWLGLRAVRAVVM